MARIRFNKVAQLPAQLQADSFYFVENGTYAESYVTNSAGVARAIGNTAMISALIASQVSAQLADFSSLQIVADIAARDALPKRANFLVLVVNATADATVKSGAAMYAYNKAAGAFSKVSEYESMDVILQWASIVGGPSSSPAQIDAAVAQSHTHANKATLDKVGEDADGLLFGGSSVDPRWATLNW